jgi:hypothetical protein
MPVSELLRVIIEESKQSDLDDPSWPFESPLSSTRPSNGWMDGWMDAHKSLFLLFVGLHSAKIRFQN